MEAPWGRPFHIANAISPLVGWLLLSALALALAVVLGRWYGGQSVGWGAERWVVDGRPADRPVLLLDADGQWLERPLGRTATGDLVPCGPARLVDPVESGLQLRREEVRRAGGWC